MSTAPQLSVVITPVENKPPIDRNIALAIAGVLIAAVVIFILALRGRPTRIKRAQSALQLNDKLDALDEMLLEKTIGEDTYKRLRDKYEGRMKSMSEELGREENKIARMPAASKAKPTTARRPAPKAARLVKKRK